MSRSSWSRSDQDGLGLTKRGEPQMGKIDADEGDGIICEHLRNLWLNIGWVKLAASYVNENAL
jgi:hypothetical protein